MLKPLAAKHCSTVPKRAARHMAKVTTDDGPRRCFEARREREGKKDLVARFGGIPLRQERRAGIPYPAPGPAPPPPQEPGSPLPRPPCEPFETRPTVAVHPVARPRPPRGPRPRPPPRA